VTTFTITSPTAGGALPSGFTQVGGIVLDLIGLNGVRIVSQLSASSLFSGTSSSLFTIGTQTGFTPAVLAALGGGLSEVAVRITLYDGDTSPGDFDHNDNLLLLDGVVLGNFSNIQTQQTTSDGTTALVSAPPHGFENNELRTGWFYSNNATVLQNIFTSLQDGSLQFRFQDSDSGDNVLDFTQGVSGGLIDVGQPPAPANTPPVSAADAYATNEDVALVVGAPGVLQNDTDGENNTLTAVLVSGPAHGTLVLNANGSFTYTPNANYNGSDSFTYKANDGTVDGTPVTVNLTVNPVNDAPVIVTSTLNPALGACSTGAVLGADDLSSTDVDSSTLIYTLDSLPSGVLLINGEMADAGDTFTQQDINAGLVQLLGGPNQTGDSFNFTVRDGDGGATSGTFNAPYAAYDTVQTAPQWGGYWGGNGNDYQLGTANADNMSGGNGCDLMVGGDGNDQMHGQEGNNRLFGQGGDDNLSGGGGNDLLDGGAGNDQLHANGGHNWLFGGGGADTMSAGEGNDRMWGGGGNDTINANGGHNRIDAGGGNDTVTAGNGDDTIILGTGSDVVYANGGNNKFKLGGIAGAISDGDDQYTGGWQADKYALYLHDRDGNEAGWGNDVINGFRISEGDQLVAFNPTAGFWDDETSLASLITSGFVSGTRGTGGNAGDLTLNFGTGAVQSSVTLKWFFWDNGSFGTTNGSSSISNAQLISILKAAVQDGGSVASGSDFLTEAHNYVSRDFMLA